MLIYDWKRTLKKEISIYTLGILWNPCSYLLYPKKIYINIDHNSLKIYKNTEIIECYRFAQIVILYCDS